MLLPIMTRHLYGSKQRKATYCELNETFQMECISAELHCCLLCVHTSSATDADSDCDRTFPLEQAQRKLYTYA